LNGEQKHQTSHQQQYKATKRSHYDFGLEEDLADLEINEDLERATMAAADTSEGR